MADPNNSLATQPPGTQVTQAATALGLSAGDIISMIVTFANWPRAWVSLPLSSHEIFPRPVRGRSGWQSRSEDWAASLMNWRKVEEPC